MKTVNFDRVLAAQIVIGARAAIASMPTGDWRRELRARVSGIEREVHGWAGSDPSEHERKEVTEDALELSWDLRDGA
jgi:hypothetical protein